MCNAHNKRREMLDQILKLWKELELDPWDKYDWATYTSLSNEELHLALKSLQIELEQKG